MLVYQVVNAINGKRYIGITIHAPEKRLKGHLSAARSGSDNGAFHRALRKYGAHLFSVAVIEKHETIEALKAAEVRLIAELQPEYNSTTGGDGRPGGGESHFTPEGRAKMRAFHTGKGWHRGHRHTAATRARLREIGLQQTGWAERAAMGPKAISRKVRCMDDGAVYESAAAAARAYGVAPSALIELCRGQRNRKTVGGKRFSYEGGAA